MERARLTPADLSVLAALNHSRQHLHEAVQEFIGAPRYEHCFAVIAAMERYFEASEDWEQEKNR